MLTDHMWKGTHEVLKIYTLDVSLKITKLRLHPHLPGANELRHSQGDDPWGISLLGQQYKQYSLSMTSMQFTYTGISMQKKPLWPQGLALHGTLWDRHRTTYTNHMHSCANISALGPLMRWGKFMFKTYCWNIIMYDFIRNHMKATYYTINIIVHALLRYTSVDQGGWCLCFDGHSFVDPHPSNFTRRIFHSC